MDANETPSFQSFLTQTFFDVNRPFEQTCKQPFSFSHFHRSMASFLWVSINKQLGAIGDAAQAAASYKEWTQLDSDFETITVAFHKEIMWKAKLARPHLLHCISVYEDEVGFSVADFVLLQPVLEVCAEQRARGGSAACVWNPTTHFCTQVSALPFLCGAPALVNFFLKYTHSPVPRA